MSTLALKCFYTNSLVQTPSFRAMSPTFVVLKTDSSTGKTTREEMKRKGFTFNISKSSKESLQRHLEEWAVKFSLPSATNKDNQAAYEEIAYGFTRAMLQGQKVAPFPTFHFFKDFRVGKWGEQDVYMLRYCVVKSECIKYCAQDAEVADPLYSSVIYIAVSRQQHAPLERFGDNSEGSKCTGASSKDITGASPESFMERYKASCKRELVTSGFFIHEADTMELGTAEELYASACKYRTLMASFVSGEVRGRFPFTRSYAEARVNLTSGTENDAPIAWLPICNQPYLNSKSILAPLCEYNARVLPHEVQAPFQILFASGVVCAGDPYACNGSPLVAWNEERLTKAWGARAHAEIPAERYIILANLCGENCGREVAEFVWKNSADKVFEAFTNAKKGEPVVEGVPIDAIKKAIQRNVGLLFCAGDVTKKRLVYLDPHSGTTEPAAKRTRVDGAPQEDEGVSKNQEEKQSVPSAPKIAGPPGTLYNLFETKRINLPHSEHERLKFLQEHCAGGSYIEMFFSPDGKHCFYGGEEARYTQQRNCNPDLLEILPCADVYGPIFKFDNFEDIS